METRYAYVILDLQSRVAVAKAKTLKGALRAAEKRNAQYGSHRYTHMRASFVAGLVPIRREKSDV